MRTITLSLISHTNVGKTTLARTLLRREVGEVRDQAHVTETSESWPLIETDDVRLILWDTPGFGDTARLMKRLRAERNPVGWFLHQVWDRWLDRPLYCSQQAVRNVKDEADVVLYLVNATEEPDDAGYIPLELDILGWMERPVLMLLNQVGTGGDLLVERWRSFVESYPAVRDVLPLDAFARCWVEETVLLRRIVSLLPGDRQPDMQALVRAWDDRNRETFRQSAASLAAYLARAAADGAEARRPADGKSGWSLDGVRRRSVDRRHAREVLGQRLDASTVELMDRLLTLHGLEGSSAERVEQRLRDFQVQGGLPVDEKRGALAGAVVSGALGGLAADLLSGGLSLGGGMIAGGILGALGGSGLARGYRLVAGDQQPLVRWTEPFLHELTGQAMLRYLAIAHFGRGRGPYDDPAVAARWRQAVQERIARHTAGLDAALRAAARESSGATAALTEWLGTALDAILNDAYPSAR